MPYKDVHHVRRTPTKHKFVSEQTEIEAINNSIRNILLTKRGTLPGDPLFGSKISLVLFSPLDGLVRQVQDSFIREAITQYEPRVLIEKIDIDALPEFNRLNINLTFQYFNTETGEVLSAKTSVPFDLL